MQNEKVNLLFLDTETTGLEEPSLIQLAWKSTSLNVGHNKLYKPTKPIEIAAMEVHHITNKMVADKEVFSMSKDKAELEVILDDHILVAHNAPFDIGVLQNEGVETKMSICTKKVAHYLFPDSERFSMQYLRYFFEFEFDEEINPHDAWSDILVLEKLYLFLEEMMINSLDLESRKAAIAKMVGITKRPLLLKKITFGKKYPGKTFSEVVKIDRDYLVWCKDQDFVKENPDLLYTIDAWLNPQNSML